MKFTKYTMIISAAALVFGADVEAAGIGITDAQKNELYEVAHSQLSFNAADFDGLWAGVVSGEMWAQYQIARIYEGWAIRHSKPMTEAIAWYRRAAAQGHAEAAAALTRLGA